MAKKAKDDKGMILPLPSSGLPTDLGILFARARRDWSPRPVPQPSRDVAFQLEILAGGKPVTGARLQWRLSDGSPLAMTGSRVTGRSGRAVASIAAESAKGVDYLNLQLTFPDESEVVLHDIAVDTTGVRTYSGPNNITLTVAGPGTRLPSVEEEKSRRKRFYIALAGTRKDLERAIPLFNSHECLRINRVFVKGKVNKDLASIPTGIEIASLIDLQDDALEDIDVLFDVSGSDPVRKLAEAQRAGKRNVPTIIAPECGHLIQSADALETLRESRSPLEDIADDALE